MALVIYIVNFSYNFAFFTLFLRIFGSYRIYVFCRTPFVCVFLYNNDKLKQYLSVYFSADKNLQ